MAPRDLRRRPRADIGEVLTLRLGYRPPYDFESMLGFLRTRALPAVERVDECSYARVIAPPDDAPDAAAGWLRVSAWPGEEHALQLQLHGVAPSRLLPMVSMAVLARRVACIVAISRVSPCPAHSAATCSAAARVGRTIIRALGVRRLRPSSCTPKPPSASTTVTAL